MMLLMLPAVIVTQEDQDIFPDYTTMNTVRPTTVLIAIASGASPSSTSQHKKSGKGKRFDYNDCSFRLLFKNYTTHILVALTLELNGLRQSCTSYQ